MERIIDYMERAIVIHRLAKTVTKPIQKLKPSFKSMPPPTGRLLLTGRKNWASN